MPETVLSPDDRAALRRSVHLTHRLISALFAADHDGVNRGVLDLAEELLPLHRRLEPDAYAKQAGIRP